MKIPIHPAEIPEENSEDELYEHVVRSIKDGGSMHDTVAAELTAIRKELAEIKLYLDLGISKIPKARLIGRKKELEKLLIMYEKIEKDAIEMDKDIQERAA